MCTGERQTTAASAIALGYKATLDDQGRLFTSCAVWNGVMHDPRRNAEVGCRPETGRCQHGMPERESPEEREHRPRDANLPLAPPLRSRSNAPRARC